MLGPGQKEQQQQQQPHQQKAVFDSEVDRCWWNTKSTIKQWTLLV